MTIFDFFYPCLEHTNSNYMGWFDIYQYAIKNNCSLDIIYLSMLFFMPFSFSTVKNEKTAW